MSNATTTEPLADVQEGDWVIREFAHEDQTITAPHRQLRQVMRRTARIIWIGFAKYRLSGEPGNSHRSWYGNTDSIRLPRPGEVEELREKDRAQAEAREETGKQYSRKRERYIAMIYAAARRAGEHSTFLDMLAHWESGTWDDDLARIDAAKQAKGTD